MIFIATKSYLLLRLEGDWLSYPIYKITWSLAQWWRFEPAPNHDVNLLRGFGISIDVIELRHIVVLQSCLLGRLRRRRVTGVSPGLVG